MATWADVERVLARVKSSRADPRKFLAYYIRDMLGIRVSRKDFKTFCEANLESALRMRRMMKRRGRYVW